MPGKLRELLDRVNGLPLPPQLTDWNDTYLFNVEDDEPVRVTVRDGMAHVDSGADPAGVSCTVKGDEDHLYNLLTGEINAQTAWMRGEIEIQGDLQAAARLNAVVRARRAHMPRGVAA